MRRALFVVVVVFFFFSVARGRFRDGSLTYHTPYPLSTIHYLISPPCSPPSLSAHLPIGVLELSRNTVASGEQQEGILANQSSAYDALAHIKAHRRIHTHTSTKRYCAIPCFVSASVCANNNPRNFCLVHSFVLYNNPVGPMGVSRGSLNRSCQSTISVPARMVPLIALIGDQARWPKTMRPVTGWVRLPPPADEPRAYFGWLVLVVVSDLGASSQRRLAW